jgi:hypothetical protein
MLFNCSKVYLLSNKIARKIFLCILVNTGYFSGSAALLGHAGFSVDMPGDFMIVYGCVMIVTALHSGGTPWRPK